MGYGLRILGDYGEPRIRARTDLRVFCIKRQFWNMTLKEARPTSCIGQGRTTGVESAGIFEPNGLLGGTDSLSQPDPL